MNVLYVGSGKSAKLVNEIDLNKYHICCVNNAWKLFNTCNFNTWIHSGDFPLENYPKIKIYTQEISYHDYSLSSENIIKKLDINCSSPQHYLGYTIFFMGIYWIIDSLKPSKISLIGFDHDYNPKKVKLWEEKGKPNPQNDYFKNKNQTIDEWSKIFFKDMEPDFFYGHGTPDPLRLGESHLKEKFELLIKLSEKLNVNIVNLSPVESNINIIKKK